MLRLVEAMPGMVWLGMAWQSGLGGVRRAWECLERQGSRGWVGAVLRVAVWCAVAVAAWCGLVSKARSGEVVGVCSGAMGHGRQSERSDIIWYTNGNQGAG